MTSDYRPDRGASPLRQHELELEGHVRVNRRDRDPGWVDPEVGHRERRRAGHLDLAAADLRLDADLDLPRDAMDRELARDGQRHRLPAVEAGGDVHCARLEGGGGKLREEQGLADDLVPDRDVAADDRVHAAQVRELRSEVDAARLEAG